MGNTEETCSVNDKHKKDNKITNEQYTQYDRVDHGVKRINTNFVVILVGRTGVVCVY